MNTFFKVIVLQIGLFESLIIDERHFSSRKEAIAFAKESKTSCNFPVIIKI